MKPFAYLFFVAGMILLTACGSSSNESGNWQTLAEYVNKGQYQAPNPAMVFKSEVFSFTDQPARIIYEFNSPMPELGGAFTVWIIEEGKDPMVDGALPQVMVGTGSQKGTQEVQLIEAGRYYLEISGMGDWEVRLEQMR